MGGRTTQLSAGNQTLIEVQIAEVSSLLSYITTNLVITLDSVQLRHFSESLNAIKDRFANCVSSNASVREVQPLRMYERLSDLQYPLRINCALARLRGRLLMGIPREVQLRMQVDPFLRQQLLSSAVEIESLREESGSVQVDLLSSQEHLHSEVMAFELAQRISALHSASQQNPMLEPGSFDWTVCEDIFFPKRFISICKGGAIH